MNLRNILNGETVYEAYCPKLGVYDYGNSVEEVLESIKDGIELAIDVMAEEGEEVPVDNLETQIISSAKVQVPSELRIAVG